MTILGSGPVWTRRHLLGMGATLTGGLFAAASLGRYAAFADAADGVNDTLPSPQVRQQIEEILQAQGHLSSGVLQIRIERDDIDDVTLHGIPISAPFHIHGTLSFQNIGYGLVMMSADMALRAGELDAFTEHLLAHDIIVQAAHQRMFDLSPAVWFVHFRAKGDPGHLAAGVKAALDATSTPFPQVRMAELPTPLPAGEIGTILGAKAQILRGGVVQYQIPRRERLVMSEVRVGPAFNTATRISFQPSGKTDDAAVICDCSVAGSELRRVLRALRACGFRAGSVYNQEIPEHPQLYFSHHFKTGDSLQLARDIRAALTRTNLRFA